MVARRSYAIVFAFIVMLLSLVLISFGTYALFTSQRQFHGHLDSGRLAVEVTRVDASTSFLDPSTGKIIKYNNETDQKLADDADVYNVFGLPSQEELPQFIVVPTCKEIATFEVSHAENSNVAFDYYVKFTVTSGQTNKDTEEEILKLAEQLEVTVDILGENNAVTSTKKFTVAELEQAIKSLSDPIATVLVGEKSTFRVTVEFKDLSQYNEDGSLDESQLDNANNLAMSQSVYFDMTIIARQSYTYDNPGNE